MSRLKLLTLRCLYITLAFAIIGVGIDISIKASLGVGSWTVFHLGVTNFVALTQGQVSQLVGLCIIAASFFLGVRPALGTIMNMVLIGWFFDISVALALIPPASSLLQSLLYLAGSTLIFGFGGAMYMSAGLGAGPRDSLMLALTARTGWPVGKMRTVMELTVLIFGWLMGGPVGLGTVVLTFSLGPAIENSFKIFHSLGRLNNTTRAVIAVPIKSRAAS
ncbi:MAG: hypothetical protein DDT36_01009 [Firmicutes bacterium]|nr:hypothetical protein [Bacillota bacterium]